MTIGPRSGEHVIRSEDIEALLAERGYLERRWDRQVEDLLYRATDLAVGTQEFYATTQGAQPSLN